MGGRTEGRTDGRTEGGRKTDGRAGANGRRADGRADDFERQYNDFHRFSQNTTKNTVFFCRFASGGSASTDFYSSHEKGVKKMSKNHCVCLTFQITREREYRFLHLK